MQIPESVSWGIQHKRGGTGSIPRKQTQECDFGARSSTDRVAIRSPSPEVSSVLIGPGMYLPWNS